MVLFLYVIMMLNLNAAVEPHKGKLVKFAAVIAGGLLMLVMVAALQKTGLGTGGAKVTNAGMVESLGQVLYRDFMLPFEISAILFLTAMVGAVMLGKKESQS